MEAHSHIASLDKAFTADRIQKKVKNKDSNQDFSQHPGLTLLFGLLGLLSIEDRKVTSWHQYSN